MAKYEHSVYILPRSIQSLAERWGLQVRQSSDGSMVAPGDWDLHEYTQLNGTMLHWLNGEQVDPATPDQESPHLVDFQDLLVYISKRRAVAVEGEVAPLSVRVRYNNSRLDYLGSVLANLSRVQSYFDSDAEGSEGVKDSFGLNETYAMYCWDTYRIYPGNKALVEGAIQALKADIDGLNSRSQLDMTRMQSLVDRRDESFSTASSLMSSISDSRSNVIGNF